MLSHIFYSFDDLPGSKIISALNMRRWDQKTLIGCVNNNQKQPRFNI